jgi:DNA-binding NarL/FixJ family response regulator
MAAMIRVFACESQPVVVEGLRSAFEETPDLRLAGTAPSPVETLSVLAAGGAEILLVDHDENPRRALNLLAEIQARGLPVRAVLWVRDLAQLEASRVLQLGVAGVVAKFRPVADLFACLRTVATGQLWIDDALSRETDGRPGPKKPPRLTPREREVLALVSQGMRNAQIAKELSISPGTVKVHLMHVFEKTGAQDRFDLAIRSRKLLRPEPVDEDLTQPGPPPPEPE